MENIINLIDVNFNYDVNLDKSILSNINLQINKGEFLAILGHNGSGKSTLVRLFNAMLLPSSGNVFVNGVNTKDELRLYDIRRTVGLILQNPDNQIVASVVEEDVAFGPENLGLAPEKIRLRVEEALEAVDMLRYRKATTYGLSGGQKQRVAIAGVIAMRPQCIVLDESTAMLDPTGRQDVINTVKRLNREQGITVVLVTHHMDEVIDADRVLVMNEGQIAKLGTPLEVFSDVDFLKRCKLSVPQPVELFYGLKKAGLNLPRVTLNEADCVEILREVLMSVKEDS